MFSRLLVVCLFVGSFVSAAEPNVPGSGVQWIWDAADESGSNEPRYFRRVFELVAKPEAAELFATCDNSYVAYVNGIKLGGDDAWNSVEKYDLKPHLVVGKNVIAIEARNQGGPAGLLAWVSLTENKKTTVIGTDATWKFSLLSAKDWHQAALDDAAWKKPNILGPAGIGPWNITGGSGSGTDVNPTDKKITSYRPAEEEQSAFKLPEGFEIELIANEPAVINPVCIAYDEQGRLYASESHTYRFGPSGSPVKTPTNPIVRLDPKPDGKGYDRVVVAEGFDDPVMGMVIRDNQLWAAANNFLFRFDLSATGPATNKQTILIDKNKAWNPFGMFVLEWGPEGRLYLSVGNHDISITGPDERKVTGRGGSGIVCRMKPDGSGLERLVHGLRVPYSFDFDPFGQLWVLSNGEGNPNRFVRVIEGVDYHCYSRPAAGNEWLCGRHPLSPPCFELPRGACTQLVRYYGSAYPQEYVGNLFLDNWGAHGFGGPNRTIFRYVPDARGQIVEKEPWLVCSDPHFRCSHLLYDPDGNLLISDWYGRDDESDLTGRIWRVKYVGKEGQAARPKVEHTLDSPNWKDVPYAIGALSSPQHRVREKAKSELAKRGGAVVPQLVAEASQGKDALGAAEALWTLAQMEAPEAKAGILAGSAHGDPRVRRLVFEILRRRDLIAPLTATSPEVMQAVATGAKDSDPAVRLAAATLVGDSSQRSKVVVDAIAAGAGEDQHLRYEAASLLARCCDKTQLAALIRSEHENLRLIGLIAIDVACFDGTEVKPAALEVLAELLAQAGANDWDLILTLAEMNADAKLLPAVSKLVSREDVPAEVSARGLMLLRKLPGANTKELSAVATKRFLNAVEGGKVKLQSPNDHLLLLELLAAEPCSPFALREVGNRLTNGNKEIQVAAHTLARKYGREASSLADPLWKRLLDKKSKLALEDRLTLLATVQIIEEFHAEPWQQILAEGETPVVRDAIRSWRNFKGNAGAVEVLTRAAKSVVEIEPAVADDLRSVFTHLGAESAAKSLVTPESTPKDEDALRGWLVESIGTTTNENAALGRRVFERAACVKCHTALNENTLRAPSLKGIGKAQKPEYLVESLFEPSKIIKTGYETEVLQTSDGKALTGLVKEVGDSLRVITAEAEVVLKKTDVESRKVQKVSLMPEGQHKSLSAAELRDLLAYLRSLQ